MKRILLRLTSPLVCRHKETGTCSFLCTLLTQSYRDETFSCCATQITKAVSSSVDTRPRTGLPPTTGAPCQSATLFHPRHPPSVCLCHDIIATPSRPWIQSDPGNEVRTLECVRDNNIFNHHPPPAHKHDQQHPHQPFSVPSETEQEGPFFSPTPLLSP